jgi:hypothetical protein
MSHVTELALHIGQLKIINQASASHASRASAMTSSSHFVPKSERLKRRFKVFADFRNTFFGSFLKFKCCVVVLSLLL